MQGKWVNLHAGLASIFLLAPSINAADIVVRVYESGEPLSGAEIFMLGDSIGMSDYHGRSLIENLEAGDHIVEIEIDEVSGQFELTLEEDDTGYITFVNDQQNTIQADGEVVKQDEPEPIIGLISGRVIDANTGYPVEEAVIEVVSKTHDASEKPVMTTDSNGDFAVRLLKGRYQLIITHPELGRHQLSDVQVLPSIYTQLDLTLTPPLPVVAEAEGTQEQAPNFTNEVISVVGYRTETSIGLERQAKAVVDILDASMISRVGDSDVSSALARVSGVSLEGDKFAVVRGLKGRYVTVTLNGVRMGGTDPYRRDVALDIYPSFILKQLEVQKSYTADKPGESTAANININSALIPEEAFYDFSISTTYTNNVTGENVVSHYGSDTDYLGFDDGLRNRPQEVIDTIGLTELGETDLAALNKQVADSFTQRNEVFREDAPIDTSVSFSTGNKFDFGNANTWGYLLGVKYSNKWDYRRSNELLTQVDSSPDGGSVFVTGDYDAASPFSIGSIEEERSKNSIEWGSITSFSMDFFEAHQITLNTFFVRDSDKVTEVENSRLYATISEDFTGYSSANSVSKSLYQDTYDALLQWTERQSMINQLLGSHEISDWGSQFSWIASLSDSSYEQPDRVVYSFVIDDTVNLGQMTDGELFIPQFSTGDYLRSYEDLDEELNEYAFNFEQLLFENDNISTSFYTGYDYLESERTFVKYSYGLLRPLNLEAKGSAIEACGVGCDPFALNPNQFLTSVNNGSNFFFEDLSNDGPANIGLYDADYSIESRYFQLAFDWYQIFDLSLGMRRESFEQTILPAIEDDRIFPNENIAEDNDNVIIDPTLLNSDDWLRAANLTIYLFEDLQFRYAYGETLARPSLTESADGSYFDDEWGLNINGNPDLEITEIRNIDYRLEYYFARNQSVSLSYFRKNFINPIEIAQVQKSQETQRTEFEYRNAPSGFADGGEFEFRTALDWGEHNLFVMGNYAKLFSELALNDEFSPASAATGNAEVFSVVREMSFQPEYIVNLTLGHDYAPWGLSSTVVFNRTGRKYSRINDALLTLIAEEPINSLKLLVKKDYATDYADFAVTLSIDNILEEEYRESLEQLDAFRVYDQGREFKLAFNADF
ncbi:MAG: carboxypeptidase regulatory-like domain-containing protein [Pseudomonadota bacterium]